jgi:hypothetical protein
MEILPRLSPRSGPVAAQASAVRAGPRYSPSHRNSRTRSYVPARSPRRLSLAVCWVERRRGSGTMTGRAARSVKARPQIVPQRIAPHARTGLQRKPSRPHLTQSPRPSPGLPRSESRANALVLSRLAHSAAAAAAVADVVGAVAAADAAAAAPARHFRPWTCFVPLPRAPCLPRTCPLRLHCRRQTRCGLRVLALSCPSPPGSAAGRTP